MFEIHIADRCLDAPAGSNLLDQLLQAGLPISYSCRSGHCQSCLIKAEPGTLPDAAQAPLPAPMQAEGWLLACQCPVEQDLHLRLYDPASDGLPAQIEELTQLAAGVLRLRLRPARPLRFHPGQHLVIWLPCGTARTFSIASQTDSPTLEFHLQQHAGGQFCHRLLKMGVGGQCHLGNASGHLHYQPDWQDRPLLLLARGTGLAPLQAIARDALQQGHSAGITLWHWQRGDEPCYLKTSSKRWPSSTPACNCSCASSNTSRATCAACALPPAAPWPCSVAPAHSLSNWANRCLWPDWGGRRSWTRCSPGAESGPVMLPYSTGHALLRHPARRASMLSE
ncbi:2Fe-2S iron-sulfur cluster-binding protein [Halopseudomonas pachastrellae]|nr:2Fe-2S iron-sulfur cluster-binding protein [Halopseudomonas pachastrellae]